MSPKVSGLESRNSWWVWWPRKGRKTWMSSCRSLINTVTSLHFRHMVDRESICTWSHVAMAWSQYRWDNQEEDNWKEASERQQSWVTSRWRGFEYLGLPILWTQGLKGYLREVPQEKANSGRPGCQAVKLLGALSWHKWHGGSSGPMCTAQLTS